MWKTKNLGYNLFICVYECSNWQDSKLSSGVHKSQAPGPLVN